MSIERLLSSESVLTLEPMSWTSPAMLIPANSNSMYRNIHDLAGWLIRSTRVRQFTGRVSIEIRVHKPGRRRDTDNIAKPLSDALVTNCVIIEDSDQLGEEITLRWDPSVEAEQIVATVRAV